MLGSHPEKCECVYMCVWSQIVPDKSDWCGESEEVEDKDGGGGGGDAEGVVTVLVLIVTIATVDQGSGG